jgi:hypothetical protein
MSLSTYFIPELAHIISNYADELMYVKVHDTGGTTKTFLNSKHIHTHTRNNDSRTLVTFQINNTIYAAYGTTIYLYDSTAPNLPMTLLPIVDGATDFNPNHTRMITSKTSVWFSRLTRNVTFIRMDFNKHCNITPYAPTDLVHWHVNDEDVFIYNTKDHIGIGRDDKIKQYEAKGGSSIITRIEKNCYILDTRTKLIDVRSIDTFSHLTTVKSGGGFCYDTGPWCNLKEYTMMNLDTKIVIDQQPQVLYMDNELSVFKTPEGQLHVYHSDRRSFIWDALTTTKYNNALITKLFWRKYKG